MRLGEYSCELQKGSISYDAYKGKDYPGEFPVILERHRHRYEFNNDYREQLVKAGLRIGGLNPERDLVEIIEIEGHPFFVGVQFHPELSSRPLRPHPLFMAFIKASGKK